MLKFRFPCLTIFNSYLRFLYVKILYFHLGEDGPSQMALEDIAMFRAIPSCVVFYPSDAVSAERAVELAANQHSMCYIRTSRPATVCVYGNDETFHIGHGKVSSV